MELDTAILHSISSVKELFGRTTAIHDWEVPGDSNKLKTKALWIERSWMNRINGKYYYLTTSKKLTQN